MKRIRIEGERVTLRPLRLDELDASIAARSAGGSAHPTPPDREKLRARFERSGLMVDGVCDLAIDVGGVRIGEIQTYVPPDRELPPGTFEVGIAIDDPAVRGRGYGSEAVELFVGWLVASGGAERVNMHTVESNVAMRTVLDRLGFTQQGTVRDHGVEYLSHFVTRDAWQARRRSR